jgi:hypothetical protein
VFVCSAVVAYDGGGAERGGNLTYFLFHLSWPAVLRAGWIQTGLAWLITSNKQHKHHHQQHLRLN